MFTSLPTWIVTYSRRPRLGAGLTSKDYKEVEVGAPDREAAASAVLNRYPEAKVIHSVHIGSALGFS